MGITGVMGKWWVATPQNGMTDGNRGVQQTRSKTVGNSRVSPRESSLLGLHSRPYEVVTGKNWWGCRTGASTQGGRVKTRPATTGGMFSWFSRHASSAGGRGDSGQGEMGAGNWGEGSNCSSNAGRGVDWDRGDCSAGGDWTSSTAGNENSRGGAVGASRATTGAGSATGARFSRTKGASGLSRPQWNTAKCGRAGGSASAASSAHSDIPL